MAIPLNYQTPPPKVLHRTPWLVLVSRWFALLSVVMYVAILLWEPGYQFFLRENDYDRWASNELERRWIERDRRDGLVVPPGPPIPTPVAAGPVVRWAMMIARGIAFVWAVWFAFALAGRRELVDTREAVHPHCIYKLAIVAPMMMLCIAAYVRPMLETGSLASLWVVAAECASIGVAWYLLIKMPLAVDN